MFWINNRQSTQSFTSSTTRTTERPQQPQGGSMWGIPLWVARRRRRGNHHGSDINSSGGIDFPTITVRNRQQCASTATSDDERIQATAATTTTTARTSMPLLYSLARSWAWEAVRFRCQTHPAECSADLIDHRGDNVLHWTVFGRPPVTVVRQLLQTCPELAQRPNKQGLYPLHGESVFLCYRNATCSAGGKGSSLTSACCCLSCMPLWHIDNT